MFEHVWTVLIEQWTVQTMTLIEKNHTGRQSETPAEMLRWPHCLTATPPHVLNLWFARLYQLTLPASAPAQSAASIEENMETHWRLNRRPKLEWHIIPSTHEHHLFLSLEPSCLRPTFGNSKAGAWHGLTTNPSDFKVSRICCEICCYRCLQWSHLEALHVGPNLANKLYQCRNVLPLRPLRT